MGRRRQGRPVRGAVRHSQAPPRQACPTCARHSARPVGGSIKGRNMTLGRHSLGVSLVACPSPAMASLHCAPVARVRRRERRHSLVPLRKRNPLPNPSRPTEDLFGGGIVGVQESTASEYYFPLFAASVCFGGQQSAVFALLSFPSLSPVCSIRSRLLRQAEREREHLRKPIYLRGGGCWVAQCD